MFTRVRLTHSQTCCVCFRVLQEGNVTGMFSIGMKYTPLNRAAGRKSTTRTLLSLHILLTWVRKHVTNA